MTRRRRNVSRQFGCSQGLTDKAGKGIICCFTPCPKMAAHSSQLGRGCGHWTHPPPPAEAEATCWPAIKGLLWPEKLLSRILYQKIKIKWACQKPHWRGNALVPWWALVTGLAQASGNVHPLSFSPQAFISPQRWWCDFACLCNNKI